MAKITKITVIAAVLLLASMLPVSAQRTAKGERFLRLNGDFVPNNGYGADASFGLYTMNGFWDFSVEASMFEYRIVAEEDFVNESATSGSYSARAGYMYRLLATRARLLNLYAGGGLLLGAGTFETSDDGWNHLNRAGRTEWTDTVAFFRYGIYPKVEVEAFFLSNLAFDVAVKCPVTLADSKYKALQKTCGVIHCEVSAGLKYNF